VCGESRKHGSGRGGRKRTSNGNALAAYSTEERGTATPFYHIFNDTEITKR
jgi:hypothetical protein